MSRQVRVTAPIEGDHRGSEKCPECGAWCDDRLYGHQVCETCLQRLSALREAAGQTELGQKFDAAVSQLGLPPATRELWVEPLIPVDFEANVLYVTAPYPIRRWVKRRYRAKLTEALNVRRVEFLSIPAAAARAVEAGS